MIPRHLSEEVKQLFTQYPVVTILGPRQSGKSTLVKSLFPNLKYINLEAPDERQIISSDPREFLENLPKSGAIIDEIQKLPELLSYIQVYIDEKAKNGQFILTGSHQLELHQAISQSLAGRTAILKLLPLSIQELNYLDLNLNTEDYILKGFLPKLYKDNIQPNRYYQDYVNTYVERDVRQILNVKDLGLFQDFLYLIAGRIGQLINYNNISNELGVSYHTVKQWISILEASYILIKIRPYFANINKRVVKSSKICFTDPGLACYLLGIENKIQLKRDPLRGNLFENMAILELIKFRYNLGKEHNLYFYRDNNQNEIDILFKSAYNLIPIEIKSSKTFHIEFIKGLKYINALLPDRISNGYVIYSGEKNFTMENFKIINFKDCAEIFKIPLS